MITEIISLCISSYFVNGCKKKKKKVVLIMKIQI